MAKAPSIPLKVELPALIKWAKKMKYDVPKLVTQSYGRACSGLKKKLLQVMQMGGGVNGVPKFHDYEEFTKELMRAQGKDPTQMGGILSEPWTIVAYKKNGWQYIGWPDKLAAWAVNFQDAVGNHALEYDSFRHRCHQLGIKDVPREYAHNPRQVIPEPFGAYVRENLNDWAKGALAKQIKTLMKKAAK